MRKPKHKAGRTTPIIKRATGAVELVRAQRKLAAANRNLDTLYAALDNVNNGLLLLNDELRAVYSNPVLHEMFKSHGASEIRKTRPLYAELLAAAARASSVDLKDYVERRLDWVRSGDPTPMDLTMADGRVLRCQVAVLPDGGRMLIYSDVTDIVRHAEELERLATTDGLTGLCNRRHFLTLAEREWAQARRYRRPLAFLMIDLDRFKKVNDTFGHQIGDAMIMHIARRAGDCKRESDVLARIGGEEFALLLPETGLDQACAAGERLRRTIASSPLTAGSRLISATVSIGIATAHDSLNNISDLMKVADQALYDAKRMGRDRIVCRVPAGDSPAIAPSPGDAAVKPVPTPT